MEMELIAAGQALVMAAPEPPAPFAVAPSGAEGSADDEETDACRVCGWDLGDLGREQQVPLYTICDCCGAETGLDDYDLERVRHYRADWFARGCPFWSSQDRPAGWSFTSDQARRIPLEYR
ncbi:hypothetical protein [Kineococcus sp. NUM-3379]